MPYKLISPSAYEDFVRKLGETQPAVAAPFWKEGKTVFELIGTAYPELGEMVGPTGYIPTLLPPKKYLYPTNDPLLNFTAGQASEVPIDIEQLILVGVRSCDINALHQMDKIYLEEIEDPYYKARRTNTLILGWDCVQHCDDLCFCESVGGLPVRGSYDLFFTPLQEGYEDYIVSIGSIAGADLLSRYAQSKEVSDEMMDVYLRQQAEKLLNFPKRLKENIGSVPLLLTGSYESPLWKEQGNDLCLGCGACIIVCPTCSCFDVRDETELDLNSGQRKRYWDGCMVQDFALVAGGHNFRRSRTQRLRHRMYRKFKYQMQRYGEPYCTGCGRCIRSCLVDINPFEILNRLFELNLERRQSKINK